MTLSIDGASRRRYPWLMKRSLKRWLWVLVSIILSTGVYFTIRYGLRPKPIPVINPTEFTETAQIGAVIYRRLRQEIRAERVLLLGSTPELKEYAEVWTGLLKTAFADEVQLPVLFQREGLSAPYSEGGWESVTFNEHMVQSGELVNLIKQKVGAGHLVVVHDATPEVTHLLRGSLSRELDQALGHPVLSISTLALTLTPEEIQSQQSSCMSADSDMRLECAEWRVSKILAKKTRTPDGKIWAVMERHGLKEYLVFIHH